MDDCEETLAEAMDRITREAERLGAAHILAGVDQIQARLRNEQDRVLRRHFES